METRIISVKMISIKVFHIQYYLLSLLLIYTGLFIGAGGFQTFFRKNFVAQGTIEINISWPSNFVKKYFMALPINFSFFFSPLSANPTKWPNTLKQFVGKLPTNCLSAFDHFVELALKGLRLACVSISGQQSNNKRS